MVPHTKDNFTKMIFTVKVDIYLTMEEFMKDNGKKIWCMVGVNAFGLMGSFMMESMKMIKNMDMEYMIGNYKL